MFTLLHHPFSAPSRMVRIVLAEKNIDFDLIDEKYWEREQHFLELNPAGEIPVLLSERSKPVCGAMPICEFIEETAEGRNLLGRSPALRAETRRLVEWFNHKFYHEVTKNLVWEKFFKHAEGAGYPNSKALSAGRSNIHYHLDYIGFLTAKHRWLNGDEIGLADIAAAAHLSVLDYFGDVPWEHNQQAKSWYQTMKSRPSFEALLHDKVAGVSPARSYAEVEA